MYRILSWRNFRFRVRVEIRETLIAFIGLLVFAACAEDIDINGNGPATPIVYCFLNPDDSFQYVRLSKTFIIPMDNPEFKPAKSDLVYEEEPEIYISEDESGSKQQFFKSNQVDGFRKEPGWFPVNGMQIFASKIKIKPSTQYSLILYFKSENRIVFGQTTSFGSDLRIIDPSLVQFREADLFPGQDYYVRFNPVVNAKIFQTTLTFTYDEVLNDNTERKEFVFHLEPLINEYQDIEYLQQRVSGRIFFMELAQRLRAEPGVVRRPVCFKFQISCGGNELYYRVKSEINVNAFSEILYTNLDNAQGLFSSLKNQIVDHVLISRYTIDSIAMSPKTKHLGFLSFEELSSHEKTTGIHSVH